MKIVFLAYEYPPYYFGGVGSFSRDLSVGLSLSGIKLTVIAYSHLRTITKETVNDNLTILRVPIFDFPPQHLWWQTINRNLLVKLLSKIAPDLIHSNSIIATLPLQTIRRVSDTPQIVTVHGDHKKFLEILLKNNTNLLRPTDFLQYVCFEPLYEKLLHMEMDTADCVVAVAQHVKNDLSNRFKAANLLAVHNGIKCDPVFPARTDIEAGVSGDVVSKQKRKTIRIAFVGRLFWMKGITHSLNAFSTLMRLYHPQNVELNIYGDGPLKGLVRRFIKSQQSLGSVHYYGQLPRHQLMKELQNSDIVIIPSLYEACPMILLESLSYGKAIVVSDMPWSAEFIEDGINGLRVNTRNPENFAESLMKLIDDIELREIISKNGAHLVEKYSMSNTVKLYKKIYTDLL